MGLDDRSAGSQAHRSEGLGLSPDDNSQGLGIGLAQGPVDGSEGLGWPGFANRSEESPGTVWHDPTTGRHSPSRSGTEPCSKDKTYAKISRAFQALVSSCLKLPVGNVRKRSELARLQDRSRALHHDSC